MRLTSARRLVLRVSVVTATLAVGSLPLAAQQNIQRSGVIGAPVGYSQYGDPVPTTLDRLASYLADLQRKAVRVSGLLVRDRDGDMRLREGVNEVLLVAVRELNESDILPFFGKRIEVVGLAREIPDQVDNCALPGMPPTDCQDWNLPMLPARGERLDLPRNSVTFWAFSDDTPLRKRDEEGGARGLLGAVVANPHGYDGQTLTLIGHYRGANLFGDLPEQTRRKRSDWVIALDDAAVWVTGKKPQGKGWRLDLDSRSDSRWFIEVTGKVQVEDGAVYVKAQQLQLKRTGPGS